MEKEQFWEALRTGEFASMVKETANGKMLNNSDEVFNMTKPLFAQENDVEQLWCIFLDTKNRMTGMEKLSSGTLTRAIVYTRELIKKVLQHKAAAIILVHNHPSGDPTPSKEDILITGEMTIAMASIGVPIHDHIIVGNNTYRNLIDVVVRARNSYQKLLSDLSK